jgi:hypothetical protein
MAANTIGRRVAVPRHRDRCALPGLYEPVPDALTRLKSTSDRVTVLGLAQSIEI